MIKKKADRKAGSVKVTFSVPDDWSEGPVSVVGDFNDWDPLATPLRKRGDVRSASVLLEPGAEYAFRYLDTHGRWHDDPDADGCRANELGGTDCLIDLRDVASVDAG
ncbi:MAG: isoamylase early set domain-containing protein [Acidimicrobiales bacterium]